MPCFFGFFLMSRTANTPSSKAKGAGTIRSANSPAYPAAMARPDRPTGSNMRIAALLDQPSRRIKPVKGDYVGFQIPNELVVGYGLDYAERYRNLKDVCVLTLPEGAQ